MPSASFEPGDSFSLSVAVTNKGAAFDGALVVVLEGFGGFFFLPGFSSGVDSIPLRVANGSTTVEVVPPFPWPNLGSPGAGLRFSAALFTPDLSSLIAGPRHIDWSYNGFGDGLTIRPEALLKVGPVAGQANEWILPTGRKVTPAGQLIEIDQFGLNLWDSPDGRYLIITHGGRQSTSLTVYDTVAGQVSSRVEDTDYFVGLQATADGKTIYASTGGKQLLRAYDFNAGALTQKAEWTHPGDPGGLVLSRDESTLFCVTQIGNRLLAISTADGSEIGAIDIPREPYTLALNPNREEVYVTLQGLAQVVAVDVSDPANMAIRETYGTQKNPEQITINDAGTMLYVTNADEDSVTVINLAARQVERNIDLRPAGLTAYGSAPNALWIDEAGNRLYIAEGYRDAITVLNLATGRLIGHIPACWMPTAVRLSRDGSQLYIVNAKGLGSIGDGTLRYPGRLQIVPVPSDAELAANTAIVEANNNRPGNLFDVDLANWNNPVPLVRGAPSEQIKHVLIVVKENKTYDSILGDWGPGDGDGNFCLFCGDETVNHELIADTFASADNYYSNADVSIQGHCIVTMGMVNTYVEKSFPRSRSRPIQLDEVFLDTAYPKNDSIFQHAIKHGISFRNHGQGVGAGKDLVMFDERHTHWGTFDPPIWNPISYDVDKLAERILAWEAPGYVFPQIMYMLFPNDHGLGSVFPFPTLRSMIADNDMATGQLIDWLSKSPHWRESVVFILEDDPQQGSDHVDRHRSIFFVASPWVKRGYVSPVHYNEANMWATIGHILGMPPLTIHDEVAQPMWDLFTMAPDFTRFDHIPRVYPEEFNQPSTRLSQRSKGLNFHEPDEAVGLQRLVQDIATEGRILKEGGPEMTTEERQWAQNWFDMYTEILDRKGEQ